MSEGDTQLGHTSVRSVALSPSIISEITNQNEYLKNLWLQEQEQNNILKAKLLKLEKKIESISLLEASANRILQKCFLAAESVAKQNDMFQTFAVELTTTLQVKHAALFFIDKDTNTLWSASDYSYDINNSTLGLVYLKNKIIHIDANNQENNPDQVLSHSSTFEDSSTKNILKRGVKTNNLLGYPIRHPLTNKIVAIIEIINKISGSFTEADLFAVKTISSRVALTLAHSQYYFAMQKKLEHVQQIELEKRQTVIKNSQISIQKSIRAVQFSQYLLSWTSYGTRVQGSIIEMLKQIFKCPVAFFHISNHHSGINTNHHETSDELASIYEEITSGTGIEVDMEKSQNSAFLLVRTIKTSVGRVENDNKIVGIVAVKRQKDDSVEFDAQDIALFEHVVRSLCLSRKIWLEHEDSNKKIENMKKSISLKDNEILYLKQQQLKNKEHFKLFERTIYTDLSEVRSGHNLHTEITNQIGTFIDNIETIDIYLLKSKPDDYLGKIYKSIDTDNENTPVKEFNVSENRGILTYVANHGKLATVSKPSNDYRCNTSYDHENHHILCVPLIACPTSSCDVAKDLNSQTVFGIIKICREKKYPEFTLENEKDLVSYISTAKYILRYSQLQNNLSNSQPALNAEKSDDYKRAEKLSADLILEQRLSMAMSMNLTSIHEETELFHVFNMVCNRLFGDTIAASYVVDSINGNLWQPVGKKHKKRHIAGVGVAGYVIETGETINLSNAKISEIYEESVDGFINDDDVCAMLCKPIAFKLTKGMIAPAGCILLRRSVSGRNFLPSDDKLLERLISHLSLVWKHIIMLRVEKNSVENLSNEINHASVRHIRSMHCSTGLMECSNITSLCSFLQFKMNGFCSCDIVKFFRYEKGLLVGPGDSKIRLGKKSIVTYSFRERQVVLVNQNVQDHAHFSFEIDKYDEVSGPASILYFPIQVLDLKVPFGVLCLYKKTFGKTFSSTDEQIMHAFCAQVCSKINFMNGPIESLAQCEELNAELNDKLAKKEEHMKELRINNNAFRSICTIFKQLNGENIYTCLKHELQKLCEKSFVDVIIISNEPPTASFRAINGTFFTNVQLSGILLETYRAGKPKLIENCDVAQTLEYEMPNEISRKNRISSMLMIPLVSSNGTILGIVRVGSQRGASKLTEGDKIRLCQVLAVASTKIEIMNLAKKYSNELTKAENQEELQKHVDTLKRSIISTKSILAANNLNDLYTSTEVAMKALFHPSRCTCKIFLVKDGETVWDFDPSSMKERQINRMSETMSRVMVSKKPVFTSLRDGLIVMPILIDGLISALLQLRGTCNNRASAIDQKSRGAETRKPHSQVLVKVMHHYSFVLAFTMKRINKENLGEIKHNKLSSSFTDLQHKYVKEKERSKAVHDLLREMLVLCMPLSFKRLSAVLHGIICGNTNAKTMRIYIARIEQHKVIEYRSVDCTCGVAEGFVGEAAASGAESDSSKSLSMRYNSFSKCDMPAPTPSLSDIFTVRCFPIMSSSRALQETFQSLEVPVCIGVLQVFTNVNEPLSADDENFINFFISQVESVITINLEREKSRCQIKMLQDGIDEKVKAIDNLKSAHEKNIQMKEIKHNNAIVALESAKNLAIEELRELNSNNLKSFSKSEQKLQMKINMQLFLWKVVEATKTRPTAATIHSIFHRVYKHIIRCSSAFILLREKGEKKYVFYPCNGAANNQPKFVSPPINLLNVFENSGATLRLFGDDEKDEHNIAELEQAIGSEHVGPIKYVLAAGLSTEDSEALMENHEGIVLFIREVETNFVVANERDDDVIDTEDYVFTTADLDTANIFSETIRTAFNFYNYMQKKELHEVKLNQTLRDVKANRDELNKKLEKSYTLQTDLMLSFTRVKSMLFRSSKVLFEATNTKALYQAVQMFCEKHFHTSSIDLWWTAKSITSDLDSLLKKQGKSKSVLEDTKSMEQPSLYTEIISTKEYICIDEVSEDSRFDPSNDYMQQRKTVTFIGMPLFLPDSRPNVRKSKVFGILSLFKNKAAVHASHGTGFSDDEIEALKHITNIVAVVLASVLGGETLDTVRENLAQINISKKKLTSENKNYEVKTSSLLTNLNFTKTAKQRMEKCISLCVQIMECQEKNNVYQCIRAIDTLLPVDEVVLFNNDPANGNLLEEVMCSVSGRARRKIPYGSGCVGYTAKNGIKINIKDASANKRYNANYDGAISCGVQTALSVPVRDQHGKPFGVLYLINRRNTEFVEGDSEDLCTFTYYDEELASNVAACIGATLIQLGEREKLKYAIDVSNISNHRMKEQLDEAFKKNDHERSLLRSNLTFLVGATSNLMKNINVPYGHLSEQVCNMLSCKKVYVFVFNHMKKELVSYNYLQDELHPHRMGLGQGIPGVVVSDGQPIVSNSPQKHKNFNSFLDARSSCQTENLLCVPCVDIASGKTMGVIYAINHPVGFKVSDIDVLQPLASITAAAIAMYRRKGLLNEFSEFSQRKKNNTTNSQMQTDPDKEKIKLDEIHKQLVQSRLHHKKQLEKVYKTTEKLIQMEKRKFKSEKDALIQKHQEELERRLLSSTNLREEFS